jgi:hypothetical protein
MSSTIDTKLDANQVIKQAYDEANKRLRVDATVTASIGEVKIVDSDGDELQVNPDGTINVNTIIDAASDNIAISDGTNTLTINPDGSINAGISGTINPSGLSTALRASRLIVTSVATQIPAAALTGRNTMSVRILGDKDIVFGDSTVTFATGYPKYQFEEMVLDIQTNPTINLWAVCNTGDTCEVAILEIG